MLRSYPLHLSIAVVCAAVLAPAAAQYYSFERTVAAPPFSIEPMIRTQQFIQGNGSCFMAANAEINAANGADMLLLKMDVAGNVVHDIAIGNPDYHDVGMEAVQIGSNLFVGGYTRSIDTASPPTFTSFVVRLDTALNFLSQKNYILPGPMELYANSMTSTANGQLLIGGQIYDGADFQSMLMKVNGAGDVLWIKQYEIPMGERFNCIRELPGGDILISGSMVFGFELVLPFACKVNMNGDFLWGRIYNYPPCCFVEQSNFMFIHALSVNDILLAGHTDVLGAGGEDFFAVDIDSSGAVNWARTYGASQFEFPYAVQVDDATNELVMLGNSGSFSSTFTPTALAMRMDRSSGALLGASLYGDTSSTQQAAITQAHRLNADARFLVGWRNYPANDLYIAGLNDALSNTCNAYSISPATSAQVTTTGDFTAITTSPAIAQNDIMLQGYSFMQNSVLCESAMGMHDPLPGAPAMSIMPNPTNDAFLLMCAEPLGQGDVVTICDVNGLIVRTLHGAGTSELPVKCGSMDPGVYQVCVAHDGALLGTARLVVDR